MFLSNAEFIDSIGCFLFSIFVDSPWPRMLPCKMGRLFDLVPECYGNMRKKIKFVKG